jgi:hypothetical protein
MAHQHRSFDVLSNIEITAQPIRLVRELELLRCHLDWRQIWAMISRRSRALGTKTFSGRPTFFWNALPRGSPMRISLMIATACFMSAVGNVSAQPEPTKEPALPIEYFNVDNVSAVLTNLQAVDIKAGKTTSGLNVVRYQLNKTNFFAVLVVCPGQSGCLGLLLGAGVQGEGAEVSFEVINEYNEKQPFSKAVRIGSDHVIALSRYVISDGGISEANLRSNVLNFSIVPAHFARFVSDRPSASLQPRAPLLAPLPDTSMDALAAHIATLNQAQFRSLAEPLNPIHQRK